MQEISGQQHHQQPQPSPRYSQGRPQEAVVRQGGQGGQGGHHDTILKRNTGAHGWQAADI